MTLQQLKYLIAAAENGSITEAAKKLYISQPSLSGAIREVEKETKLTIFNRHLALPHDQHHSGSDAVGMCVQHSNINKSSG